MDGKIKQYEIEQSGFMGGHVEMVENKHGEWVRYDDHVNITKKIELKQSKFIYKITIERIFDSSREAIGWMKSLEDDHTNWKAEVIEETPD